jgi:LysM repeat protein
LITEREKFEFESLPEFVREPRPTREPYVTASNPKPIIPPTGGPALQPASAEESPVELPKTAELEALWPGISHDFLHASPRKGPSFYLCIGFAAGALFSWIGVWGYCSIAHIAANPTPAKGIVVAQGQQTAAHATASGAPTSGDASEPDAIAPASAVYQVSSGDTLAGIALKNYHRATPRLLDEICRTNSMTNANVLKLGQKLNLPEYHPQRIASGVNQVQQ